MNKLHLGKLTYLFLTVQSLFTMQTTDAGAVFDGKGQKNHKKMIFAAAMNFRAEAAVCRWHRGQMRRTESFRCVWRGESRNGALFMSAIACDSQSSADQRV